MALIIFVNTVIVATFTRARVVLRKSNPWVDLSALRELSYTMFTIGSFLAPEGIYFAYIYESPSFR